MSLRTGPLLCMLLLATHAAAAEPTKSKAAAPTAPATSVADPSGEWRGARWGMSVEEVLKALPGEAKPMKPEIKLADGATVAVEVPGLTLEGQRLHARFVFAEGKLIIVSLRSPADQYVQPEVYQKLLRTLAGLFGAPAQSSTDDSIIDMRQSSWTLPKGTADLKYIPGVLVLQYHPTSLTAEKSAAAAPPKVLGGPEVLETLRGEQAPAPAAK